LFRMDLLRFGQMLLLGAVVETMASLKDFDVKK